MRLMFAVIGVVITQLIFPVSAFAQTPPAPLQPTSNWEVNYAENECRLLRQFGTGEQMVILRFTRASSPSYFDMVLAGPAIPDLPLRPDTTLRLDPQGAEISSDGYSMQIPGRTEQFLRLFDANSVFLAQFNANQILQIDVENTSISLNLLNVRAALTALQTCHDDLMTSWGFDPVAYRALRTPPQASGSEATWVTTSDYPSTEASGITTMRLRIGLNGRVSECSVVVSSGTDLLDSAACSALTRRARYDPAIGADGAPTEAMMLKRVRWQLPN
ncbi:MAG: energy transducer TonB [Sphingopyxis sp.]